jgi:hypothetical protein
VSLAARVGRLGWEVLGGDGGPIEPFVAGFHQHLILGVGPGAGRGALQAAGGGPMGSVQAGCPEHGGGRVRFAAVGGGGAVRLGGFGHLPARRGDKKRRVRTAAPDRS